MPGASATSADQHESGTPREVGQSSPSFSTDAKLVGFCAAIASLAAFFLYFRRGELLLFGDAVAHLNLARRLFDSLTPGFDQLGTVWLPLPHLAITPFVVNNWLWRSGVGGAIPSMIAYVFGTIGMFRLVSEAARRLNLAAPLTRAAGWLAAAIYAANPNLLYLQTTAMSEPLYLACFVWSLVWLQRFFATFHKERGRDTRALVVCGLLTAAAELCRYEGWFLAGCILITVVIVMGIRGGLHATAQRRLLALFAAIALCAPAFWLAYNYAMHGNPLDFASGPYSARAIELRGPHGVGPLHPGDHDLKLAAAYYVRTAEADLGQNKERYFVFWIALVSAAALCWLAKSPVIALLWAPLPFYIYSIACGSVPIFMPELWPWSYYNTRYGTAVLPAIAASFALIAVLIASRIRSSWRSAVLVIAGVVVALTYVSAYRMPHHRGWSFPGEPDAGALVWREAKVNAVTRQRFESALAQSLRALPRGARLLMDCSNHVGALQQAAIPFRNVINEANWPMWDQALRSPASDADFVIAITGDPVAEAVAAHPEGLEQVASIEGDPDQGRAIIYRSRERVPH